MFRQEETAWSRIDFLCNIGQCFDSMANFAVGHDAVPFIVTRVLPVTMMTESFCNVALESAHLVTSFAIFGAEAPRPLRFKDFIY